MKIILNVLELNKAIKDFNTFGFIPTMGGIHKGHISLIKKSQKKCRKTIVSIFVNPTQFNDKNDFNKYPRNLNLDIKILRKLKIDYLFIPKVDEMYKKKFSKIHLNKNDKILCAKFRKNHFEGVLNIMNRLLDVIKSKYVFMGEKDYQQLFLIKKYLAKKYKIKVVNCIIVRDKNKVALSTRNSLLSKKNYNKASLITKYLLNLKNKINRKRSDLSLLLEENIKILEDSYNIKIDYLELRNKKNLQKSNQKNKSRLFIAYYLDKVRLIDNF